MIIKFKEFWHTGYGNAEITYEPKHMGEQLADFLTKSKAKLIGVTRVCRGHDIFSSMFSESLLVWYEEVPNKPEKQGSEA